AQVSGVTRLVRGFTNQYTLFLRADGRVFGSGYNFYGQLGNGLTSDSASPVQTLNLP
ncbi:MAG: RCC1 repeat- and reductase domain-containing protein, partial [Deltaproteobacteria bacterium]|nr:RCC1 repeat- and reductase domain-containing protein [Deltaproteobacteria bacterium]